MNYHQKGASDANQIKQASNQPRGAAERTITSAYLIDRDGQWWQLWHDGERLQATRGLDTPTPQNEVDAVRGKWDGQEHNGGDL